MACIKIQVFNEKFYTPMMGFTRDELLKTDRLSYLRPDKVELGATDFSTQVFPSCGNYDYKPRQLHTLEHVIHFYTQEYPLLPEWLYEPMARAAINKPMNRNEKRAYRRKWLKKAGGEIAQALGEDGDPDDDDDQTPQKKILG